MNETQLYHKINALPDDLKKKVEDFVDALKKESKEIPQPKKRQFGCAKGFFEMAEDFDEPLDDFKEYME